MQKLSCGVLAKGHLVWPSQPPQYEILPFIQKVAQAPHCPFPFPSGDLFPPLVHWPDVDLHLNEITQRALFRLRLLSLSKMPVWHWSLLFWVWVQIANVVCWGLQKPISWRLTKFSWRLTKGRDRKQRMKQVCGPGLLSPCSPSPRLPVWAPPVIPAPC